MEDFLKYENTSLPDVIELKDVEIQYPDSDKPTIKNLNFLVEDKPNQGQIVVILGNSGCGKSSLLRLVSGLQKPSSGQVLLYGKPRTNNDRVGMVFQRYSSLPWLSVLDNVALGLEFSGVTKAERLEQAREMIALVGLEGHEHKYAQYPTLSGGQLQRVAIARSLLANPKILLLDEPFGALDISTRLKMQDLMLNIWKKLSAKDESTTILFVTHDITEAVYLADDIVIMKPDPGRIVKSLNVGIPFSERTKETKHTNKFRDIVSELEDYMQG